jgi:hypothetical protein
MRHGILTALGVLTAVTGFATSVHAQPTAASNSNAGDVTLSGESLVGIQNRTAGKDSNRFFLGNSATPAPNRSGTVVNTIESNNIETNNNLTTQQPGVLQISEDVQVVSNEPLYHPSTRVPGQQHLPFQNIDRAQVQIDVAP